MALTDEEIGPPNLDDAFGEILRIYDLFNELDYNQYKSEKKIKKLQKKVKKLKKKK